MTEIIITTPEQLRATIKEAFQELLNDLPKESPKESQYMTRGDLAEKLKVSPITIDRWRRQGTLKGHKIGSRVLFDPVEVQAAIETIPTLKKFRR